MSITILFDIHVLYEALGILLAILFFETCPSFPARLLSVSQVLIRP